MLSSCMKVVYIDSLFDIVFCFIRSCNARFIPQSQMQTTFDSSTT